jgi:hypothetical protein
VIKNDVTLTDTLRFNQVAGRLDPASSGFERR